MVGYGEYRSGRARAWVATIGVLAMALLLWMVAIFQMIEHFLVPDWETSEELGATVFALAYGWSGLTLFIALGVGVLGYLFWIYRAAQNARALGRESLMTTPGTAVFCWLIPILNLFRPYQVVRALYQGADSGDDLRGDWVLRRSWLFPIWWGAWMLSNVLSQISTRMADSNDASTRVSALWLDFVTAPVLVIAGLSAVAIVWSIEARHAQLARLSAVQHRAAA